MCTVQRVWTVSLLPLFKSNTKTNKQTKKKGQIDFHVSFSIPGSKDSLPWTWQNYWALAMQKVTDQSLASMNESDKVRWISVLPFVWSSLMLPAGKKKKKKKKKQEKGKWTAMRNIAMYMISQQYVMHYGNLIVMYRVTLDVCFHHISLEDWRCCREGCVSTNGSDSSRNQDISTNNYILPVNFFFLTQCFFCPVGGLWKQKWSLFDRNALRTLMLSVWWLCEKCKNKNKVWPFPTNVCSVKSIETICALLITSVSGWSKWSSVFLELNLPAQIKTATTVFVIYSLTMMKCGVLPRIVVTMTCDPAPASFNQRIANFKGRFMAHYRKSLYVSLRFGL